MKRLFILNLLLFFFGAVFAQCPSGAMGVTGAGCGCLGGCNLTSVGGPNCSPSVGGNCNSGYTNMAPTNIIVPAGCTYTVTATMRNRAGCTASGADGNCQTCDVLKVDVFPGGTKNFQQGGANSTLNDSYTLVGPGTIRVSGRANRADEIITYAVTSTNCVDCISTLPVELMKFTATPKKSSVHLTWATASEINNDYFTIERSADGLVFEDYAYMDGAGNSNEVLRYSLVDSSPLEGISYYRLKQTDLDGTTTYSKIESVHFTDALDISVYPNPTKANCLLTGKHVNESEILLFDAVGNEISIVSHSHSSHVELFTENLPNGVYFIRVTYNDQIQQLKLVIQH